MDVFVLFRFEERDGMDADLAERGPVEGVQQAMQVAAQFVVEARDELGDLLLCDGGAR